MTNTPSEELCAAAIAGNLEVIDRLLTDDPTLVDCQGQVREDHRAFMTEQDAASGWTPLHLASYYGQPEAVRRLIAHGADVNSIAANSIAGTPVHTGTAGGQPTCVKVILTHGPDLTLTDSAGLTALALAQANDAAEIISLIEGS